MTITACPIEGATIEQQVAERIEILAALIQLNSDDSVYSANPRLINVLHITPLLREHRAGQILRTIMPSLSRDGLIKQIVSISYGNAVSEDIEDLTAAIDDISALWDQELGGIAPILAEAYQTMVRRVALLYDGIDPVNDLTRMTGEEDKLRIVINPSLFLPPPQTGRHGASIVSRQHGDVSHLFFGYPLDDKPEAFGITRYWIMGGGWHYAVDRFIHRHWPDMAEKLRAMPEVEQVIVSMLAPHRDTVTWPTVLAEHASIALKCALSRQESESESVHRRFAQARGLVLFPWFDEWIRNLTSQSANFVNAFEALPEKIEQEYTSLVEIADISHSGPPTINMALASGQGHATIVIPDNWEQTAFDAIAKRWEIVTPHVMRETQWREHSEVHNSPVIAFGQASHDELIKSAMMEHQLQLNPSAEGGDLLLALLPVKTAKQPWRLLIAVEDKSVATRFPAEQALDLFHRVARFSSLRFVEGDTPSLSTSS